jgi:LysM repeat protein
MSSRRTPRRGRRGSATSRSAWVYIAPAALLTAVTAIMMILSSTGVIGHTADGGPPPSNAPAGPVQTLSVPQTKPPAEPPPATVTPLPLTTAKAKTATTATTTSGSTTASTTATTTATTTTTTATTTGTPTTDTTPATTPPTGNGGQHVKWTVKTGDTLSSIATQFQTSVKELERLNPSVNPAALQIGQQLVVR